MTKFLGTGVALVTPFNEDRSIDFDGLERLVNFVIDGGVEYLVALGTTAESATLSTKEKKQVVDKVLEVNNQRVPVVLGIGSNNTATVIEAMKETDFSGIDAILSVSPYYNKPTQEGIYQHFKQIAKVAPRPIIIYNVPGRTASNIEPETVFRLAHDFKNIIGIKEAKGDMVQSMRLLKDKPEDFLIISGDDMITLPMVLAGGAGVISVIGQGLPEEFTSMVRLGLKGEQRAAYELHYKLMDSIDMIFEEGNPAGIKSVLKKRGICEDTVRLPLVEASAGLKKRLSDFVDNLEVSLV